MNKIISIIAACVALTSCEQQPYTHEEWQQKIDREVVSRITKFNYEGHSYLLYQHYTGSRSGVAGICHDENCECRKDVKNGQD